jgi:hypothetical protein
LLSLSSLSPLRLSSLLLFLSLSLHAPLLPIGGAEGRDMCRRKSMVLVWQSQSWQRHHNILTVSRRTCRASTREGLSLLS